VSVVVLGALAVAVMLLVWLHLAPTGLSPAANAVSDYGTTKWHVAYREQAIALGVAGIALAIGLRADTDAGSLWWLYAYGASQIAIAGFMTDRDPPPYTAEGRIHWVLVAVAFTSIAFAATSINWTGAPGALEPLGIAVGLSAIATLVTRFAPGLDRVFGIAERALYATSIAWLAIAAVSLL
jgi:Protein of unknown function (DUF998)